MKHKERKKNDLPYVDCQQYECHKSDIFSMVKINEVSPSEILITRFLVHLLENEGYTNIYGRIMPYNVFLFIKMVIYKCSTKLGKLPPFDNLCTTSSKSH